VQIEISTRHGGLDAEQQRYLHDKAEKLQKYFGRLMAIEVAVDHVKHAWDIEILVSAEHKHDFVAPGSERSALAARWQVSRFGSIRRPVASIWRHSSGIGIVIWQ